MIQISMFDTPSVTLGSYMDIDQLLSRVREGEEDDDLFTWSATAKGRTYSFYGTKVFEFAPSGDGQKSGKLTVVPEVLKLMGMESEKPMAVVITTEEKMNAFIEALKIRKHVLFRNLITDTFACCNDFLRCSEAGACIHPENRFYNGCLYRTSLEKGRIFFGAARNMDPGGHPSQPGCSEDE